MSVQHLTKVVILVGLFGLVQACSSSATPIPKVPDDSLLSELTCEPPCWQGLQLGRSSRQDALDFVQNSPLIAGNSDARGVWWWAGERHDPDRTNFFNFQSDLLTEIHLHPNTDITLAKLLAARGAPSDILISKNRYDYFGVPGYHMQLFYTELGVEILFEFNGRLPDRPKTLRVCPDPDHPASRVDYFYPEDVLQSRFNWVRLGTTDESGVGHYSGDVLGRFANDKWTIKCLEIWN